VPSCPTGTSAMTYAVSAVNSAYRRGSEPMSLSKCQDSTSPAISSQDQT
jgi:hypothetical protein